MSVCKPYDVQWNLDELGVEVVAHEPLARELEAFRREQLHYVVTWGVASPECTHRLELLVQFAKLAVSVLQVVALAVAGDDLQLVDLRA